jgi:hypothetical protein
MATVIEIAHRSVSATKHHRNRDSDCGPHTLPPYEAVSHARCVSVGERVPLARAFTPKLQPFETPWRGVAIG